MKFKYVGVDGCRDLDLVIFGVMDKSDTLMKGTVIDVPDEQTDLLRRIKINGNYQKIVPKKKKNNRKSKKRNKRRY